MERGTLPAVSISGELPFGLDHSGGEIAGDANLKFGALV